jgi:hypothetical protein
MIGHMTKRKFAVSSDDFFRCMLPDHIPLAGFSPEFQELVRPIEVGSFVVVLEGYEDETGHKMIMAMWRCRGDNINSLVAKIELESLLVKMRALGIEKSSLDDPEKAA